ncbi:MAG: carbohydrate ABC transporter permease [Treponema sp.]|nr:carbohydrate ABC transporter permease [Treponema sp.]
MVKVTTMIKARQNIFSLVLNLLLLSVACIWIYPFFWTIGSAFKEPADFFKDRLAIIPEHPTIENYIRIWKTAHFDTYFINTVIVVVCVVFLVLTMSCMAGYVIGRYRFMGKNGILMVFVASMMLPLVSTIIPTYQIIKSIGLVGTKTGLVLAQSGGAHVVFVMLFSGFFRQIPKEMEEAALMDGCGFFRTFIKVMAPLAQPISVTTIIMESIWSWNAFLLPLVLTLNNPAARTLAVGLYSFKGENTVDWTGISAGGVFAIVPIVILFLFLQKYFVNGVAGAVKT